MANGNSNITGPGRRSSIMGITQELPVSRNPRIMEHHEPSALGSSTPPPSIFLGPQDSYRTSAADNRYVESLNRNMMGAASRFRDSERLRTYNNNRLQGIHNLEEYRKLPVGRSTFVNIWVDIISGQLIGMHLQKLGIDRLTRDYYLGCAMLSLELIKKENFVKVQSISFGDLKDVAPKHINEWSARYEDVIYPPAEPTRTELSQQELFNLTELRKLINSPTIKKNLGAEPLGFFANIDLDTGRIDSIYSWKRKVPDLVGLTKFEAKLSGGSVEFRWTDMTGISDLAPAYRAWYEQRVISMPLEDTDTADMPSKTVVVPGLVHGGLAAAGASAMPMMASMPVGPKVV